MKKLIIKWLFGTQIERIWATFDKHDVQFGGVNNVLEKLQRENAEHQRQSDKGVQILKALLDYLSLGWEEVMEPDPQYKEPQPNMRKVIKVSKK